jgi:hypothetical protein
MAPDGAVGEVQLPADLLVGQSCCGQASDLKLLRGERVSSASLPAVAGLPRRSQLLAGDLCPLSYAQTIEGVAAARGLHELAPRG